MLPAACAAGATVLVLALVPILFVAPSRSLPSMRSVKGRSVASFSPRSLDPTFPRSLPSQVPPHGTRRKLYWPNEAISHWCWRSCT